MLSFELITLPRRLSSEFRFIRADKGEKELEKRRGFTLVKKVAGAVWCAHSFCVKRRIIVLYKWRFVKIIT
jgi:hypothetical protein